MRVLVFAIVAAVAATCVAADASMNGYFMTDLKNAEGEMTGSFNATLQDGVWTWNMTSSFPVDTVEIVDRKGSALEPEFRNIVMASVTPSEDGSYEGTFTNADVSTENTPYLFKEERNMTNAQQLAGHMCMGHIFAVVNGTDGSSSYGALMYMSEGEDDCYAGTGTESMRMKMDGGDHSMDMDNDDDADADAIAGMAAEMSSAGNMATFSVIGLMTMMFM